MFQSRHKDIIDGENYLEGLLIELINNNSTNALVLYGQLGIGKTTLCKHLNHKIAGCYPVSTVINRDNILSDFVILNPFQATLLKLRKNLLYKKTNLSCFDIVYLAYQAIENPSEVINLPLSIAKEIENLPIVEVINKGLYEFPSLLQNTNHRKPKSILLGKKIFTCLNWFFIQQKETIRKWWKLQGSANLQELKECANLEDILKLLPLFLARDLQLHLQETSQKAVIFIDEYEYLNHSEANYSWLEVLIKLNPSIFWIIFAEKPVDLTSNNINIPIQNLTYSECQAIVQRFGIDNPEISQRIIQASEGIPFYLHLGIETYRIYAKQKQPQVQDFARNIQEILPKLNAAWDSYERRIWQILSNCCSWDRVLFAKLMSQLEIGGCNWICDCWRKLFDEVIKSPFVELNPQGVFRLHPIVREYLYNNQPENLQQSVNAYLFNYYQLEYQQSGLQLDGLLKLLEHGLKSQHQLQTIEWFWKKITPQQQVGRHLLNILMLQFLLKHQQNTLALNLLAKSLFALGDYQQALIALQTSLKLYQVESLRDNLAVATLELHFVAFYLKNQHILEADNSLKAALQIYTTQLNDNSVEIAEAFILQAEIALINEDYSEALQLSQKALQIFELYQNTQHPQLARIKLTIASLHAINKNFELAQKLCKNTLHVLNRTDENHPLVISCHEILGYIYQKMGYFHYDKAYDNYKLALEIAEINLGLTHPQTLLLITAITKFSRIRGEYDTVYFLKQRRHANMETSNFQENPAVADRLNKIASLLYQQGKYAFSENLLQQALQINCKVLSEKHPQTAESFHNLGLIYKSQRRYFTAEVYFKQAIQIRSQILGEKHPVTAESLNSLAALYCCMGKYQQAEPLLQQALEICQQNFGQMHPHTATTLNNLAQMYYFIGYSAIAEPIFQQALDICCSVLGKEHTYTKTVESNLNRLRDAS